MKSQSGPPVRPGASGYVDGTTPHRPRQVLDWSAWREANPMVPPNVAMDKTRYVVNPAAPVILRRVDDRKAYPATYSEGSPKISAFPMEKVTPREVDVEADRTLRTPWPREVKEEPPNLPGAVQSVRAAATGVTGVWTAGSTGSQRDQLMALQAVQAVQALQAQSHSIQLPIQGRGPCGPSPWTPSNVKAACSREPSSGTPRWQVEVQEVRDAEKPKQEEAKVTEAQLSRAKPRLTVPGEDEKTEGGQGRTKVPSRSSSVAGTPEVAPRKIMIPNRTTGLTPRPESPVKPVAVRRNDSTPGGAYGSKLDEPLSPGHRERGGSTRRSRPETASSDGGRSPAGRGGLVKPVTAASAGRLTPSSSRTREETETGSSPGRRRGLSLKCSFDEPSGPKGSTPATNAAVATSRARSASRSRRSPSRDRSSRAASPTLQERTSTAMQALEHGMEPPGASDKWRVAQLFGEAVPRSQAKVLRIERLVTPETFSLFLKKADGGDNACNCGIAFYVPQEEELHQLSIGRASALRPRAAAASAAPLGSDAAVVLRPLMEQMRPEESPQAVSLVVAFGGPGLAARLRSAGDRPQVPSCAFQLGDAEQLLPAYVVHIQLIGGDSLDFEGRMCSPSPERARSQSRQRKVSLTNPLIQEALARLPGLREDAAGTVLLSSNSQEAEAVVSLYLQSGGAARLRRPPGVDLREALGGVVVQRFENKSLTQHYLSIEVDSEKGGPRFKEDVVWHGTRLKRSDGDATLAHKLQSIAERGFDPSRCIKGAHAEGGIWVASCPMESFGVGGDGLVAFIICLAKTNFNEWVDTSCARVLQRERVLPLYSLVHV